MEEKMRRAITAIVILLLGCLGGLSCDVSEEGIVIKITPEQIQERLDKKFPISKQYLMVLNLTLADPKVELREGSDRIGVGVSALTNVRVNREDLTGRAHVTTGIHYNREQGSFLLVDPVVESLTITLLPEKYQEEVLLAANVATSEFLNDYEVYRLDQSDSKQKMAKLILKEVVVKDGILRVTLGLGK
jgi:hypothetical protein